MIFDCKELNSARFPMTKVPGEHRVGLSFVKFLIVEMFFFLTRELPQKLVSGRIKSERF